MFKAYIVHISDKVLHEGNAERVMMPGVLGEFEVGEHHIPLVSLLAKGVVTVFGEKKTAYKIQQGLMRFDGERLFAVVE